jgi:hypothetical protein
MMNYSRFGRFWKQKNWTVRDFRQFDQSNLLSRVPIYYTAWGVVLVIDMAQHCTQVMRHSQVPENIATPRQLGVLLGSTSQDNVIPVGSLHLGGCRRVLWHWAKFFTLGGNLVLWSCLTTWSRGSLSWKRGKGNKLNNTARKLWIYAVQNFIVILGPHAT